MKSKSKLALWSLEDVLIVHLCSDGITDGQKWPGLSLPGPLSPCGSNWPRGGSLQDSHIQEAPGPTCRGAHLDTEWSTYSLMMPPPPGHSAEIAKNSDQMTAHPHGPLYLTGLFMLAFLVPSRVSQSEQILPKNPQCLQHHWGGGSELGALALTISIPPTSFAQTEMYFPKLLTFPGLPHSRAKSTLLTTVNMQRVHVLSLPLCQPRGLFTDPPEYTAHCTSLPTHNLVLRLFSAHLMLLLLPVSSSSIF